MGEYYIICNFEKREVLNPEVFDCAHKPGDFIECTPRKGILHGLMHLLSLSGSIAGTKRRESDHLFGRWAGDRIAIMGAITIMTQLQVSRGIKRRIAGFQMLKTIG